MISRLKPLVRLKAVRIITAEASGPWPRGSPVRNRQSDHGDARRPHERPGDPQEPERLEDVGLSPTVADGRAVCGRPGCAPAVAWPDRPFRSLR